MSPELLVQLLVDGSAIVAGCALAVRGVNRRLARLELALLRHEREHEDLELRLDAAGAPPPTRHSAQTAPG